VASTLCAAFHMAGYQHFESANGCSLIHNNWRMLHTITILIMIIVVARQNPMLVSTWRWTSTQHMHFTNVSVKLKLSSNTAETHYNYTSFMYQLSCLTAGKLDSVTNSLQLWRAESSGLWCCIVLQKSTNVLQKHQQTSTQVHAIRTQNIIFSSQHCENLKSYMIKTELINITQVHYSQTSWTMKKAIFWDVTTCNTGTHLPD
jgi:hypothetical protein